MAMNVACCPLRMMTSPFAKRVTSSRWPFEPRCKFFMSPCENSLNQSEYFWTAISSFSASASSTNLQDLIQG